MKTSTEGASGRYSGIWYSFATRATSPELAATVWSDGWRRPAPRDALLMHGAK